MTVTQLPDQGARDELADKVDALSARLADRVHQDVRAALNEARLVAKGRELDDSLDIFDKAQLDRRNAETNAAGARDALEQSEVAARWEVAGQVTSEGNKFFVPDGEERRQVTAAVRDEWIETQVRQHGQVVKAREALRKAEHKVAEAKDALERARLSIGIRRTQLEAAMTHVSAIAGTLRGER